MIEALNILDTFKDKPAYNSAAYIHRSVEALKLAYADRDTYYADPKFSKLDYKALLTKEYAAERAKLITDKASATFRQGSINGKTLPHPTSANLASYRIDDALMSHDTTCVNVIDKDGSMFSATPSGAWMPSVIAGDTGFLLNNEMDDFTIKAGVPNLFGLMQGEANAIAPGKRPLSSMSPTIVLRDGRVFLVLGSPGGARIITIALQVILNMIDYRMAPQEAVDAPRLHHQWLPDQVFVERFALSADTKERLAALGYSIVEQTPWGAAAMIAVGGEAPGRRAESTSGNDSTATAGMRRGFLYGASDPRRPAGAALGFDGNGPRR